MYTKLSYSTGIIIVMLIMAGCSLGPDKEFRTTPQGLQYKFHYRSGGERQFLKGDVMLMDVVYRTASDSLIYNSKSSEKPFVVPYMEPSYKGDVYEGLEMLNPGDSVTFITQLDSFMLLTARLPAVPEEFQGLGQIFLDVRVTAIMTKREFKFDLAKRLQEKNTKRLEAAKKRDGLMQEFMNNSGLEFKGIEGLFVAYVRHGDGPIIGDNRSFGMKYIVRSLDGTIIDNKHDQNNTSRYRLDDKGGLVNGLQLAKLELRQGDSLMILLPSILQIPGNYDVPRQSPVVIDIFILE